MIRETEASTAAIVQTKAISVNADGAGVLSKPREMPELRTSVVRGFFLFGRLPLAIFGQYLFGIVVE
jgi:hypothetical protein